MSNVIASRRVELLRGHMRNLRKKRCYRDFVFTASDRSKMGATSIAAGLVGLGGAAAGLGSIAMDTTEEADLIEFELDGTSVKAWLWASMFEEGDEVEVVAEPNGDCWIGYGIRRVSDRIVALYPHCSRGRYAHYKASFRWFVRIVGTLLVTGWAMLAVTAYIKGVLAANIIPFILCSAAGGAMAAATYGVIACRVSRRFMHFVRLAEDIFRGFGWQDVKNIDLPAITKKSKKPGDPAALGIFFFRY
jgi:hypothetical protein